MEGKQPLKKSEPRSLAEIDFPAGDGPVPHPPAFHDPRDVSIYFAPLIREIPSAEERWARKANATPFPGV